jgi:FkbM family methyltransferase
MADEGRRLDGAPASEISRLYDLLLFGTAANYEIHRRPERLRSAKDLALLFFRALEAFGPDLFIEAGAKDAGSSRRARRRLKDARIVAFEANPYTYERFKARNEKAEIEYLHLAVGEKSGSVTVNVRKTPDGRPIPDGRGALTKRGDYEPGYLEVSVTSTSLDSFFDGFDFETCALWIDVEGAARQVFDGAATILPRTSIAMVEVEDHDFWPGSWLSFDVVRRFHEAGLVPIARDFQAKYQYNIVFVREPLLDDGRFRWFLANYLSAAGRGSSAETGESHKGSPGLVARARGWLGRAAGDDQ